MRQNNFILASLAILISFSSHLVAQGPSIIGNPNARSRHMGNDKGEHNYGLHFSANVSDPQSLSDIATVKVTGPTGSTFSLTYTNNSGWYELWTEVWSVPPPLGVYTFRVTDKSGNWSEKVDTVTAILDYPKNVLPAQNQVTPTATPTFSWTAVQGAVKYWVKVADVNGSQIWFRDNLTSTSVKYNDDGTATRLLTDGNMYNWVVNGYDQEGNFGEQFHWVKFYYSTNQIVPILANALARSAHYGDDAGKHEYRVYLGVHATDPQGLTDVASVRVTGPTGTTYTITDDNSDGWYEVGFGGLTAAPQVGAYKFRATDKSGNWAETMDSVTAVLDYPRNVRPANQEFVMTSTPAFSWNTVQGATRYYLWVNDATGKQIWWKDNIKTASVVYNDDGNAKEGLKNGSTYTWAIGASDANGNWSEQNPKFTYSTNPISPVSGDHRLVTYHGGDDRGSEDYGYDYWIDVADPQGISDIASVKLITPDGLNYQLYDDATRGDGVAGDGRYSGNVRGLSSPTSLGQCRFVVTDRSNNTATIFDTLSAWVPFARNVRPAYNEVVRTGSPVFSWDAVTGVSYYQIHVWLSGAPVIWGGINVRNRTSITYNEDGTGQNLSEGKRYGWDLRTFDEKGNYGYHYGTEFVYSSNSTFPVLTGASVRLGNYGNDRGYHAYHLSLAIQVADPQGMSDIASVVVTGPTGATYTLKDDNNDSWYDGGFGGLTQAPASGVYRFRATDKSGNWTEALDTLTANMDFPRNVRPAYNEVVSTSTPTFSWTAVQGATSYSVWVDDLTGKRLWSRGGLKSVSVVYNDDGKAIASLKDGTTYTWYAWAGDAENNWSEQSAIRFTYSTNPRIPVHIGHWVVTYHGGDDRGNEDYGYDYWIDVIDPQGLSDIASVTLATPDGLTYQLYDDATRGDGTAGDGRYSGNVRSLPKASSLGQCRFVVTDKSNNSITVLDTLTAWMPFTLNVRPSYNEVVSTSTPLLSWNAVPGAHHYHLFVDQDNGPRMWGGVNVYNRTSITYNEDGNGQNLVEGRLYWWYTYAYDDNGNYGYHHGTKFTFSTNPTSPVLTNPSALSAHYGNDRGSQSYYLVLRIRVADPQGLSDIASVVVTGPGGKTYTVKDDNNDGDYDTWFGGSTELPQLGTYRFRVTDKSGNWAEALDTLAAVLDYPRNVRPANSEVVTTASPTFTWNAVQGANRYSAWVDDLTGKRLWGRGDIKTTSVVYNDDGRAVESLKDGSTYTWYVNASDVDNNWSEQWGVRFTYSTNPTSPMIGGCNIISVHYGNERGSEYWGYDHWIDVSDPQGLSDISSVTVRTPSGKTCQLTDDNGDGRYGDNSYRGLTAASETGAFTLTVTDKSNNKATAIDTVKGVIDYARNAKPTDNDVVSTATPTFSWNAVAGAVKYLVHVHVGEVGDPVVWGGIWVYNKTSIVYNSDGSGKGLVDGKRYWWDICAYDANGNFSHHWPERFTYSTNPTSPVLAGHKVVTYHGGDDRGNEDYGYDYWIDVIDPQGLSDIASVTFVTPEGVTYQLYDDATRGDGAAGDGRYSGNVRGLSTASSLGQCRFVVTDKSNNSITVLDTLTAWMPFTRNVRPSYNEVVATSTPLLSWTAVPGAHHYHLFVDQDNGPRMWGGVDVYNRTSITYNEDGNGRNLTEGKMYWWYTYAYDDKGNYGHHYGTRFTYSTNLASPILSNQSARSGHYGDDAGNQSYNLSLGIQVADPQGLSDIASMVVTGPGGKTNMLRDDNNDGWYDGGDGGLTQAPPLGAHRFRATDKSGNWVEALDSVTAVLDYPRNAKPVNNEFVTTPSPTFSWNAVPGATRYYVWVYDETNRIWWHDGLTTTSVVYNYDGRALDGLKDGSSYTWVLGALDANDNYGEQYSRRFTYSTNPTFPRVNNPTVRSRHWGGGGPAVTESWGVDFWAIVTDPQGPGDIDSVWVDGPNGFHARLLDDGNNSDGNTGDGHFAKWIGGVSPPPALGGYDFKVKDKSGNVTIVTDTLTAILDYPRNVTPRPASIASTSGFMIGWDRVEGASNYYVDVSRVGASSASWARGLNVSQNSFAYNFDGTGENMLEGSAYILYVSTNDANSNQAERGDVRFIYRNNGRRTVYVDSASTAGSKNGTLNAAFITISDALAVTVPGDTVLVAPGTYQGKINDVGSITLLGKNPVTTIIRGYVALRSPDVTVKGFTIRDSDGSGIEVHPVTNAVVSHNIITQNKGAAIVHGWGAPSTSTIKNNTIVSNVGDGITVEVAGSRVTVVNNIIAFNAVGIRQTSAGLITNKYNDYYGNRTGHYAGLSQGTGEISANPAFVDTSKKDYRLTVNSLCIDAGDPDLDGDGITWKNDAADRDPDGTRLDMGALYLDQRTLYPSAPQNLLAMPSDRTVAVRWSPNPEFNIAYYKIYRSFFFGFTPASKDSIGVAFKPDTSYVDRSVTNGQMYYYRISAVNVVENEGPPSDEATALPGKISSPVIASPPNGATNQWTTLTLTWNPAVTANTYHLQVSADSNFISLLVNDSTITTVNKEVKPLVFSTTYYWRVSAKNIAGTTAFSPHWRFTVVAGAPATVTLASPAHQSAGVPVNPTLRWNSSTGAISYHTQVASSSSFNPLLVDTIVALSSHQLGTLPNNATFYWRVRWKNVQDYGSYSTVWSFTTIVAAPSAAVTLALPVNGGTRISLAPALNWSALTDANRYHLQVSTTSSFLSTIVDDTTLATTSYQLGTLLNNTTYYWRVRGRNDGGYGPFSTTWGFTTIVAVPSSSVALAAPQNGATKVSVAPTLSWSSLTDATGYHVQVSTSSAFLSTVVDDTTLTVVSKQVSALKSNTVHYWRVRGKNDGGYGPFSPVWSFTTIAPPAAAACVSPLSRSTRVSVNPILSWSQPSDATTYRLQVSSDSLFNSTVVDDTSLTTASKQLSSLQNNITYYWRVRAWNEGGNGPYSTIWSFTTIVALPQAGSPLSPPNAAVSVPINPMLTWALIPGVTSYHLQVSTSSTFTTAIFDDTTLTTTSKQFSGLQNSTVYYWRVRGKNDAGYGPFSIVWSLTTIVAVPPAVTLSLPADGSAGIATSPVLRWDSVARAVTYHLQLSSTSSFTPTLLDDTTLTKNFRQVSALTNNVMYYWRVRGRNVGGYGAFSPVWNFTTIPVYPSSISVTTTLSFTAKARASDYAATDYRLIGLPGSSDILAKDIVTGVQNEDWEIVWDNGAATDYLKRYDGSNDFKFTTGRAFWIISKAPLSIARTVPSATLNTAQEAEIPVRSGWNLITNPYSSSIPWSRIQTANGVTGSIYTFNGAFNSATSLDPYAGYYFFNGTPSPVLTTLRVPYSSAFGKLTEVEQGKEKGWRITIGVRSENSEVRMEEAGSSLETADGSEQAEDGRERIEIGVEQDAKEGLDGYDQRMPRSLEKGTIYFDRPEWDNIYKEFGRDIKSESNQLKKWEFTLEGKLLEKKVIHVTGIESIASNEAVFLVDKDRGLVVDLRGRQEYTTEMVKGKMRFEILVGRREMVDEEMKKLMPTEIKVGPNYPNPFNPVTIIPIELPKTTDVKITIYDILGRRIKTLFDGIMETGRHYVRWDGKDEQQRRLASGVYLYRVETPIKAYVQRVILLQ